MASLTANSTLTTELIVTAGEVPKRLDVFLANREPALSRSAIQRLIEEGKITVNGQQVKPSYKIRPRDRILLEIPRPEPIPITPEPIPLDIMYEDDAVLVLNKPAGLVVHPAPGHWSGTLVNALLYHFATHEGSLSSIGGRERPGLVHRLDKETSGVMVIAKTDEAHRRLAIQFKHHTISRTYEALVWGGMKKPEGHIALAIGRDRKERKKFSARTARPKESATAYRVIERIGKLATHVLILPLTGRTHQIRVHLAFIGHPILGDPTYGGRKVREIQGVPIPRVMLHAKSLGFKHPTTGQDLQFTAPIPPDMAQILDAIRHAKAPPQPMKT